MKYKCIILDHDDTVVDSTKDLNFPAFLKTLKEIRPNIKMTLNQFLIYNSNPGFTQLCFDILNFSKEEMEIQENNWLMAVKTHIPKIFKGIKEILWDYKKQGGKIVISSHSHRLNINRDYKYYSLPKPDYISGWEEGEEKRKPSNWIIEKSKKDYNLKDNEIVVIDDLLPGINMAKKSNIDSIAAGWAYNIHEIQDELREKSNYYCNSVNELKKIIL